MFLLKTTFWHKIFFLVFSGTCTAAPEATKKLNCYSHQILQAWNVQSAKEYAPHRSTTTLVRHSIFVSHHRPRHQSRRPTLAHHRQPKTLFHRPISSTQLRLILKSEHRSILSRETWLRPWYLYVMRRETCVTRKVICVMQQDRGSYWPSGEVRRSHICY